MSRLTEKKFLDNFKAIKNISPNYVASKEELMYEKLGKLENLEEQIGCPLEVVITPYFKRGKLEVFYRGKMREVIRAVAFEQATRPYMDVFYRDNEKEQFKVKTIWLDDYKKTWWLKEDKSE